MIYFDRRWDGDTGIGRFSREVSSRLSGFRDLPLTGNPASPFDVLRLTWFMILNPRALVFSPGYSAPLFGLNRFFFTVHDLNHIDTPGNSGFFKRLYYKLVLKRACRGAGRIFTVSDFSKKRIVDWAGISSSRVVCTGNGVSDIFSSSAKNDVDRDSLRGFLFSVGNRKLHKNEVASVKALAAAKGLAGVRLVFTGEPSRELLAEAMALGIDDRVQFLGALTEEQLCGLYQGALALIFPSLYEGFGLPAIEAMAIGCPVIASATTALGEVVGDAALVVDPTDNAQITRAIEQLAGDVGLRQALHAKGIERAATFSWSRVAAAVGRELPGLITSERLQ